MIRFSHRWFIAGRNITSLSLHRFGLFYVRSPRTRDKTPVQPPLCTLSLALRGFFIHRLEVVAMPDRPETWMAIWATVTGLSATVKGAGMAVLISILRVIYDGQETNRVRMVLEAILCGSLSLCAASIIRAVGLSDDNAIAVGGAIGFLGVQTMRDFVMRWMDKWVK